MIHYIPTTELLKNVNISRMAREINIPYNTVYRYKQGQREPQAEVYIKMYNYATGGKYNG